MKIAVVGDMNSTQQLVIDKMIADGHEVAYIGKDDGCGDIAPDICIVEEYSEGTSWHAMPVKEMKKPYYRVKERW